MFPSTFVSRLERVAKKLAHCEPKKLVPGEHILKDLRGWLNTNEAEHIKNILEERIKDIKSEICLLKQHKEEHLEHIKQELFRCAPRPKEVDVRLSLIDDKSLNASTKDVLIESALKILFDASLDMPDNGIAVFERSRIINEATKRVMKNWLGSTTYEGLQQEYQQLNELLLNIRDVQHKKESDPLILLNKVKNITTHYINAVERSKKMMYLVIEKIEWAYSYKAQKCDIALWINGEDKKSFERCRALLMRHFMSEPYGRFEGEDLSKISNNFKKDIADINRQVLYKWWRYGFTPENPLIVDTDTDFHVNPEFAHFIKIKSN